MKYSIYIPHKPIPKGRPRATCAGGTPRIYTPASTRAWEEVVAAAWDGPLFADEQLMVEIGVSRRGAAITVAADNIVMDYGLRGDLDNYAKAITDALNGVAYTDDKQITHLLVRKEYESPR